MAGWRRCGGGKTKEKDKKYLFIISRTKKNTKPLASCQLSQVTPSSSVDVAEMQVSVRLNPNVSASDYWGSTRTRRKGGKLRRVRRNKQKEAGRSKNKKRGKRVEKH